LKPSLKKSAPEEAELKVWLCSNVNTCKGWIRSDFAFEQVPVCPLCASSMLPSTKVLPILENLSREQKTEANLRIHRDIL